jgi:hypothetical protein
VYAEMQDPTKNGGKIEKIPENDRTIKVHYTSVIDTGSTKRVICEGMPLFLFSGSVEKHLPDGLHG